MNHTTICGNLGADPELKTFGDNGAVLKLRVAVSGSSYNKATDTRTETTEWFRCVLFGRRAEALSRILQKGEKVLIEGAHRTSTYEKDGETKYSTDLIVSELHLLGQKRDGQASQGQSRPSGQLRTQGGGAAPVDPQGGNDYGDYDEGDVPF